MSEVSTAVSSNYQYWRDHGSEWAAEYARRKTWLVLYHIQEYMLTEYVLAHAAGRERPLRVLEFGCGVGRHLRNLSRVPGADVHGYDQSETMARSIVDWAGETWFDEHVRVGEPTGRLPYGDGEFDLVYTAEVLVHVRPEHLRSTLEELLRVCRGHVLHMEASPTFQVRGDVHDGCWKHDLTEAYRELGRECEVIEGGYTAHWGYRVTVNEEPAFRWDPLLLSLFRDMESMIDRGFDVADAALRKAVADTESLKHVAQGLSAAEERIRELEMLQQQTLAQLEDARQSAQTLQEQLESARSMLLATEQRERTLQEGLASADAAVRALTTDLESAREARQALERELGRIALEAEAQTSMWRSRAGQVEQQLAEAAANLSEARSREAYIVDQISRAIRQPGGAPPHREGA